MSLLLRLAVVAAVYCVLLGNLRPAPWGSWAIIIAVLWLAIESFAWSRTFDPTVRNRQSGEENELDAIRRARARYDGSNITR